MRHNKQAGPCLEDIIQEIAEIREIASSEFREYLYVKCDEDAVSHLLTVSSSLDSMVVGEPQIIGQVKECYSLACNAKSASKILNKLFHCAVYHEQTDLLEHIDHQSAGKCCRCRG